MKLKCRSLIDDEILEQYEKLIVENKNAKEEVVKEFMKRNFIKFYINLYKVPPLKHSHSAANPDSHMLDIHLFKGTVPIFMDYMRKFMQVLENQCDNTESGEESNTSRAEIGDNVGALERRVKLIFL